MSVERQQRTAAQVERAIEVLNTAPAGGYTRRRLAELIEVPEDSVARIGTHLRRNATEIGHTFTCLKIGGEWIYGWAETLHEHRSEHYKRRKNERRSLILSIEVLTQSVTERPDAFDLRRQLVSAQGRIAEVELELEELTGQLSLLSEELQERVSA